MTTKKEYGAARQVERCDHDLLSSDFGVSQSGGSRCAGCSVFADGIAVSHHFSSGVSSGACISAIESDCDAPAVPLRTTWACAQ